MAFSLKINPVYFKINNKLVCLYYRKTRNIKDIFYGSYSDTLYYNEKYSIYEFFYDNTNYLLNNKYKVIMTYYPYKGIVVMSSTEYLPILIALNLTVLTIEIKPFNTNITICPSENKIAAYVEAAKVLIKNT